MHACSSQVLNSHGYPHLTRSQQDISKAIQHLLEFGSAVRKDWNDFCKAFALGTAQTVGFAWVLELSALTIPGAWAQRLQGVKTDQAVALQVHVVEIYNKEIRSQSGNWKLCFFL